MQINRARANINEFGETLGRYLDQRPAAIVVTVSADGQGTVRVVRHEPIPVELSILLGEALQNLRAGLDSCLSAVAIIDSGAYPLAASQDALIDLQCATRVGYQP